MASAVLPLDKARANLDFVASEDLAWVLDGPVTESVKKLFLALLRVTSPEATASSWPEIQEVLRGDKDFVGKLQAFEPEASDHARIRDLLHQEMEITGESPYFMKCFSPACVLLLSWCHAVGDVCGCPEPMCLLDEDKKAAARSEAQEIRNARREAKEQAAGEAKAAKSPPKPAEAEAEVGSGLLLLRSVVSGEIFATLKGAMPEWNYRDIVRKMRPLLPTDAGDIALKVGEDPMDPYEGNLRSLGVDVYGEGAELQYTVGSLLLFLDSAKPTRPEGTSRDQLLELMQPMVEESARSLNCLSKSDITEVKALKNPPQSVQLMVEATGILLGHPSDSWKSLAGGLLGESDFLQKLKSFPTGDVSLEILAQIKWYVDHPKLAPEQLKKVSAAAVSLSIWMRAVYHMSLVTAELWAAEYDR